MAGGKILLLAIALSAVPFYSWAKLPSIELHLEEIDKLGTKKTAPTAEALEFPTLKLYQNSIIGNAVNSFLDYQEELASRETEPEIAEKHKELIKNVKKIIPTAKEKPKPAAEKEEPEIQKITTDTNIIVPFENTNFTLSSVGEKTIHNSIQTLKSSEKRLSIKAHSLKNADLEQNGKKLALLRAIEVRKLLVNSGIDSLKVNVLVEEDENEENYNKVFISLID